MEEIRSFNIDLTENKTVYFGGERVCGEVVLDLYRPLKLKELALNFNGRAEVHFTDQETFYSRTEQYCNIKLILSPDEGTEIPSGVTSFPFTFDLPGGLPASFEWYCAYVRYTLIAELKRPAHSDYYKSKRVITVLSHFNLNDEAGVRESVDVQTTKRLGCLCCQSGPITIVLRLVRTGFAPGETIPINLELRNQSNKRCDCLVLLVQHIKAHAYSKTETYKNNIYTRGGKCVYPGESDTWFNNIEVPPIPSSYLRDCSIIDIKYELKVKVCPNGCHSNFKVCQEIVIGTVGLGRDSTDVYKPYRKSGFRIQFPNIGTFGQHIFSPEYPYYECADGIQK